MRKLILIVFALAFAAQAATRIKLSEVDGGQSIPVMDKYLTPLVIDSSEIDTSTVFFGLLDLPISSYTDTIGQAWFRCADSAGTDSIGGVLKWQGNPLSDGSALWENIDSVTMTAGTGTTYLQTSKVVVNSKRYMAMRFILRNQLVPTAGKKSICRDIVLNRSKRIFAR